MISACGLLLLSVSNKLGRIVDRIRNLNSEDRDLSSEVDTVRRLSIRNQIDFLLRRAVLLRNACGFLYLAVAVFVLTSLCVGLSNVARAFEVLMLVLFVIGLATVVWGRNPRLPRNPPVPSRGHRGDKGTPAPRLTQPRLNYQVTKETAHSFQTLFMSLCRGGQLRRPLVAELTQSDAAV